MGTNERLRTLMLQRGETIESLAVVAGVDPKTVERWISKSRPPYTRHRYAIAAHLNAEQSYLWPDAVSREQLASVSGTEIITVHAHRWAVPRDAWSRLFDEAEEEIGVLVYSGLFLAEDAGMRELLRIKATSGVRVRLLFGDPNSLEVNARGTSEGIDDSLAGKIRNAIKHVRPLQDDGVEIRQHATTLYNSIYRADDEMLVNTHIYGFGASDAPVMHLRRVMGGKMVTTYLESFERVWASAQPLPART